MIKSKIGIAGCVVFSSFAVVLGLIGWLQGVNPFRVAQAAGLIDDSFADFSSGTGCYVRASGLGGLDGEVIVTATVDTDFPGSALPAGWFTTTPSITVSGGQLIVDEGTASTSAAFSPGQTLEFSATFTGPHAQFIGFSDNVNFTNLYAIFGTTSANDGHLYARTVGMADIDLGTGLLGTLHRFRIEWGTANITYTVFTDTLGTSATYVHSVVLGGPMSLMVHDANSSGTILSVDWARLWPWACTYRSRVIDSNYVGFTFTGISTTLLTPAGTGIAVEARTSTDGSTWGSWTPVNANGTFNAGVGQYLQYSATLSAPDAFVTPEVQVVQAHGLTPTAVRVITFSATAPNFESQAWLIGVGGLVLVLGGARVVLRRRKQVG